MNSTRRPDQEGQLEAPIIIVGTGRCGSTALHYALSHHNQGAWLSRFCDTNPQHIRSNRRGMQLLDLLLTYRYLRKLIYPVEAYRFWGYYCPGLSEPCRDFLKEDVTPRTMGILRSVLAQTITRKRNRLLLMGNRLAEDRLPERGSTRCQIHPHLSRRPSIGELADGH